MKTLRDLASRLEALAMDQGGERVAVTIDSRNRATVTISFPIPECGEELDNALNGGKYRGALQDIDERLRCMAKHGGRGIIGIEEVRAILRELVGDVWE